ncbi:hypothetical protein FNO01nite_34940 [Flavobacterium noncentrifugens]|uniref:Uncharacterized protein n=1 Tax=Flavobacterium noncentrifugens TaxID=1128970 RepID=A0A1G9DFE5_9FLAO|nr:hypothetical protein [Flavobacterium noncentrifugens]GEP52822.1 hypothetical protein FNO01nite_34940 [Flavobacterium noncentrifugens]SDK62534.1 hypothetical protein SAMN04487935_3800 [Flavobacterium noncentrifugens]
MIDYQFTVAPEYIGIVPKITDFIKKHSTKPTVNIIETKDGTVFILEIDEQYQFNIFDQDLKVSFPYIFS